MRAWTKLLHIALLPMHRATVCFNIKDLCGPIHPAAGLYSRTSNKLRDQQQVQSQAAPCGRAESLPIHTGKGSTHWQNDGPACNWPCELMYTYRSNHHSCPIFCRCWHPVCTATAAIQAARGSSYSQSVTSQRSCTKRLLVRTDAVVEARLTSHSPPVNSHRSSRARCVQSG